MKTMKHEPAAGIWDGCACACARGTKRKWMGTPWMNRMAKPGVGVDCLNLVKEFLVDAEMLPDFRFPAYSFTTGIRENTNIIEPFFARCCDVDIIDPEEYAAEGDIIIFRSFDTSNHVGIVVNEHIVHAFRNVGVIADRLATFEPGRIQSLCRMRTKGFKHRPEAITDADIQEQIIAARALPVHHSAYGHRQVASQGGTNPT